MYNSKVLSGHEAAEALDKYIRKLEKRKIKGLTEKQIYALVKTAKVLRTEIIRSKDNEKTKTPTTTIGINLG
jgi:hypothetical protein